MMIALVILLVGLVAVAELVPASLTFNSSNRTDSVAMVVAQRVMDELLDQPISQQTCSNPSCPDAGGSTWSIGNPASPNTPQGNAVIVLNNIPAIDYTASPVLNYGLTYVDPNDPYGATYDVRWAVICSVNNGEVTAKRFIVGARQTGAIGLIMPVTLDTTVER
jgi:Tfp pilus assembly protein PilV